MPIYLFDPLLWFCENTKDVPHSRICLSALSLWGKAKRQMVRPVRQGFSRSYLLTVGRWGIHYSLLQNLLV